jgi:hypothetical protein
MAGCSVSPQDQLLSVSQIAQQANPQTTPQPAGTAANQQTAPASPAKLISVSDIAKNGVPDDTATQPAIQPHDKSAVAQGMADEGVTDYKPGQGIPFGHSGVGMRTGDITPSQAGEGLATIGAVAGATVLPEVVAGAKALVPAATKGLGAVTAWAEAHPILARAVYEGIKGAVWYKTLKTISRVGNAGE